VGVQSPSDVSREAVLQHKSLRTASFGATCFTGGSFFVSVAPVDILPALKDGVLRRFLDKRTQRTVARVPSGTRSVARLFACCALGSKVSRSVSKQQSSQTQRKEPAVHRQHKKGRTELSASKKDTRGRKNHGRQEHAKKHVVCAKPCCGEQSLEDSALFSHPLSRKVPRLLWRLSPCVADAGIALLSSTEPRTRSWQCHAATPTASTTANLPCPSEAVPEGPTLRPQGPEDR
jgi:hypothetical protein